MYPPHDDPVWHSVEWRTETLLSVMEDYQLTISVVSELTCTTYSTVACWRKSVDRPISIAYLKALLFEIGRGLV